MSLYRRFRESHFPTNTVLLLVDLLMLALVLILLVVP
jgi:hypothetical protein